MGWKSFVSFILVLIVILLLGVYWFVPISTTEFITSQNKGSANFSVGGVKKDMQFYNNMRYKSKQISFKISDCGLQKRDDMIRAFDIISNSTSLEFYPKSGKEEISVTCDSKSRMQGGVFIAGEGGPTNITKAGEFNVILNGKILLIRESKCPKPNVAIHELLHALGFEHSANRNNIMYNISNCDQTVGEDILVLINDLYSISPYPDLLIEDVFAKMRGKYLDANITIRNNGLDDASESKLHIIVDGKVAKIVDLQPVDLGAGRSITLGNIWISAFSVKEIEFIIKSNFQELDKENNKVILGLKK